jgi:hypothetical protein
MPGPPRHYPTNAARQHAYRVRRTEARRQELAPQGLPPLPAIATMPGDPRWRAMVRQASRFLDTATEEMQAYYDRRSVAWQETERAEAFLERLQVLQEARSVLAELE